jgi:D-arginine dehydrogenase
VVVIGGGIAGLSITWQLARRGVERVTLLEREDLLASNSSARNAAIWIPIEDSPTTVHLARRSAELLDEVTDEPWLTITGALATAEEESLLEPVMRGAEANAMEPRPCSREEAVALSPALADGTFRGAVHIGRAGELDIHLMTTAIARAARAEGAKLRTGAGVQRLVSERGRVRAAILEDGSRLEADAFVLACGAWAGQLGRTCGASLPIEPLLRHLIQLDAKPEIAGTIVWNVDDEVYYRPESGGVLASPGDEQESDPCLPTEDPATIEAFANTLTRFAPGLADAGVRRAWACLRTFAPDRELVVGKDPRLRGLFWLAGLGGRGMTVGIAAAEVLAMQIVGEEHPLSPIMSPARLIS